MRSWNLREWTTGAGKAVGPAAWLLAAALVGWTFYLRMDGHSVYLHDHESLLVPTAGRELLHGHISQFRWYQGNVYQGSSLVDALLSMLGFAVFGDHLLAWKWYGLGYAVAIAGVGMLVLKRLVGTPGAAAFAMLLATAPFLIKDGLLTPAGGHSSGFLYAIIPLLIAVGGKGPPTFVRGLVAGVALGFGAWYMRTAVSGGPALLVALAPGGRRALGGMFVGIFSFPLLAAVNALLFTAGDGPLANRGFVLVFQEVMGAIRAESVAPAYVEKATEAMGLRLRYCLFAQAGPVFREHDGTYFAWASEVWAVAWTVGLAALSVAAAGLARTRHRTAGWAAAVLLALGVGYLATYVMSPFRVDASMLREIDEAAVLVAPGVPAPRYLVPIFLAWTFGLAGAAGLAWKWRWTRIAFFGALWVAGVGGWAAYLDADGEAESEQLRAELRPYDYLGYYGAGLGRGPGMFWHVRCAHPDPVSRAAHRRAVGPLWASDASKVVGESDYVARRLRELDEQWGVTSAEDLPFVVQGIGRAVADAHHSAAQISLGRLVGGVIRNAETLGAPLGDVLLRGFEEGLAEDAFTGAPEGAAMFCRETSWGTQPMCSMVGRMTVDPEIGLVTTPEALFGRGFHPMLLDPVRGGVVVAGAASRLRSQAPDTVWSDETLAGWRPDLATGFKRGWAFEDARMRWREGDAPDPFLIP
jgi:hypothetical protein